MTWLNIVAVNGNWGSWDAWDACSVTCGNGTRTRERRCNNPTPSIGETTCTGSAVEQDNCYLLDCPPAGRISNSNFNPFASSSKDSKENINGCVVRIENFVTRVTVRYHEAFRLMPNRYSEWRKFQFAPNNNFWLFFLHSLPSTISSKLEYALFCPFNAKYLHYLRYRIVFGSCYYLQLLNGK